MNLDPSIPPPPVPLLEPGRTIPFGLQVAYGFFLPTVPCLMTWLGLVLSGGMAGPWMWLGVLAAVVLGLIAFVAGVSFAMKQGWKGALLGTVLFGALVLLLIGVCFAMLGKER